MKAFVYQAALLCETHGIAQRIHLDAAFKESGAEPVNAADKSSFDSDRYPKGPYPQGGGEADTPQHCDQCGVFLENPLTDDGTAYVMDALNRILPEGQEPGDDESWSELADRIEALGSTPKGNGPTVAEWIRLYLAEGQ